MRGHGQSQSWACREVSLDEALAVIGGTTRGEEGEEENEEKAGEEDKEGQEVNVHVPNM